eukprot:SAG22_NODE_1398_length_4507_cov_9.035617_2_plen_82_part_00
MLRHGEERAPLIAEKCDEMMNDAGGDLVAAIAKVRRQPAPAPPPVCMWLALALGLFLLSGSLPWHHKCPCLDDKPWYNRCP